MVCLLLNDLVLFKENINITKNNQINPKPPKRMPGELIWRKREREKGREWRRERNRDLVAN